MKALNEIQDELRELLPQGIDLCIMAAKNWLDPKSDSFRELILIETRLGDIRREMLDGTLTAEAARVEFNRLSKAILLFIDGLKEGQRAGGPSVEGGVPDLKNGEILYRIPPKMLVQKEVKCIVRVAFDRDVILEDWEMQPGDVMLDRRIADVMGVQLLDGSGEGAFSINTFNEQVQSLDPDLYTEWIFKVKALREGNFPLVLKIAVIEMRNGVERKRDIIVEETVIITTIIDDQKEGEGPLKSSGQAIQLGGGAQQNPSGPMAPSSTPRAAPGSPAPQSVAIPKSGSGMRKLVGTVGMLALLVIATFALSRYWNESKHGGEDHYAAEKAAWKAAKDNPTHDNFDDFLEKYPTGSRADSARQFMAEIEDDEWLAASTSMDSLQVRQFAARYPSSVHSKSADEMLQKWADARLKIGPSNPSNQAGAGGFASNTNNSNGNPVKPKDKPVKNNSPVKINPSVSPPPVVEDANRAVPMRSVARLPIFPKCDNSDPSRESKCTEKEIRHLVGKYLTYPKSAVDAGVEGSVKVGFVVERDGTITGVKAQNSLGYGCDEEAERVVKQLPRFKPGLNAAGQPVRVLYTLPIRFSKE